MIDEEGCDCTELCSMGPTCPGGFFAGLAGAGCSHGRANLNPNCQDAKGDLGWSCIEFDGTGLWCESCLEVSGLLQATIAARAGRPEPGEFCERHFSWMCQAGQGKCQDDSPAAVVGQDASEGEAS